METFIPFRPLTADSQFNDIRRQTLNNPTGHQPDPPIADLVASLCELPFCFTLQSCFGHFSHTKENGDPTDDPKQLNHLPRTVQYQLAYLALCVEKSQAGKEFLSWLRHIPEMDPDFIQLGCATRLWEQAPNSYVLQVTPDRFKAMDAFTVDIEEAHHIEAVRNQVYDRLRTLLNRITQPKSGS